MKHEDTNSQDDAADLPEQGAAGVPEIGSGDRNIPIVPAPEPVHRWLDGESVRKAELAAPDAEKHVKFWAKVNKETERRHRMKTPRGLDAIIMDKLEPPVVKDD